jgi:hypothetical protein
MKPEIEAVRLDNGTFRGNDTVATVIGRRGAQWRTSFSIGRKFRDVASSFASRWKMQAPPMSTSRVA